MSVKYAAKLKTIIKFRACSFLRSRGKVKTSSFSTLCEQERGFNANHRILKFLKPLIMASGITTDPFKQKEVVQSRVQRNRLANEKSSYLLQHASNPVDWYPWGEEAFQKAKKENKVIFLSVGYSTCHWCHVMERESFENEEIAKIMNENFVNIKVDREERPDVDKVYMTFVQATSGSGGWPMSVWLTPDLKPILGGTYFPPDDRYHGRAGFATVLKRISQEWAKNHVKIHEQGGRIIEIIMQNLSVGLRDHSSVPGKDCIKKCFRQLTESYDKIHGGFSLAPKFPQAVNFNFLFRLYAFNPKSEEAQLALNMALQTLREMDKGGIHDHISQGFHRYSTDEEWHVPHFEKMLYDQAQLAVSYLEAFQITKDECFSNVACDILTYVSRDLSNQHGGFYCAEDADSLPSFDSSHKKEGAFCVWTYEEIIQHLDRPLDEKPDVRLADVFIKYYNVLPDGNVDPYKDPHDELKGKNVLIIKVDEKTVAESFNISEAAVKKAIEESKSVLYEIRQKRPKPHLDDKFLAAWNGMMISAFAKAAQVFGKQHYSERAMQAVQFLHRYLYDADTGCLRRSAYRDKDDNIVQIANPVPGVLEDYTFTIKALMDTYEATYDSWCLKWAEELQEKQDSVFWDAEKGAYFYSNASDSSIVFRLKEDQDGAEPNSNSVSVSNLLRLYNYTNNIQFHDKALKILEIYGRRLEQIPIALPEMICGLMMFYSPATRIVVVGDKENADTQEMLKLIHSHYLPFKTLILHDDSASSYLNIDVVKDLVKQNGLPTAYICKDKSCSLPVTTIPELENLLKD